MNLGARVYAPYRDGDTPTYPWAGRMRHPSPLSDRHTSWLTKEALD